MEVSFRIVDSALVNCEYEYDTETQMSCNAHTEMSSQEERSHCDADCVCLLCEHSFLAHFVDTG